MMFKFLVMTTGFVFDVIYNFALLFAKIGGLFLDIAESIQSLLKNYQEKRMNFLQLYLEKREKNDKTRTSK